MAELGEKNVEMLYTHYTETYNISVKCKEQRNKFFVILCVLEMLNALLLLRPGETLVVALDMTNAIIGSKISLGLTVVQSFLWMVIAYITIRYIQEVLQIERNYRYLSELERKVRECTGENLFKREGFDYLKEYPIVLNLIDLFYKMCCPILFGVINLSNIVHEWEAEQTSAFPLGLDTILCTFILIITWFYFFQIHDKISDYIKAHIKIVNHISKWLHKILKEV